MKPLKALTLVITVTLGLGFTSIASSQAMSFKCQTSDGLVAEFMSGKVSTEKNFGIGGPNELIYDQIDITKGTGRMISTFSSDIRVINGDESIHLVEKTKSGNMTITTIFLILDSKLNIKKYPFVHSRHMNMMGMPIPSQYYGYCTRID